MTSIEINTNNIVELINGGEGNVYHLLFYMISNFRMIDYDKPLVYYYPKTTTRLVEEFLDLLPPHFIRDIEKQSNVVYRPFLHTTQFKIMRPFFPDWTLPYDYDFIRELYLPKCIPIINKGQFIYISRDDAKSRKILNENSLLQELIPMGFKRVLMSELSVLDQMNLFSQSDIIISPHGAGMSFMVFGSSNTTIIELNKKCKTQRHFSHIAWHLEMDYYKIICDEAEDTLNMIADVNHIVRFLKAHPKICGK